MQFAVCFFCPQSSVSNRVRSSGNAETGQQQSLKKVSCIAHVSFANYAHFQVVSQQGRKVVQRDPKSQHCGDAAAVQGQVA